ncbi:hypothetical protein BDV12DRAFT_187239 [Aspergillus spectabilis]
MALILQAATFAHQYLNSFIHSQPTKSPNALKLGVLSSAQINAAALIYPAETHPGVILHGIASRSLSTAQSQARKYSFKKAYGSYEDLLSEPEIDVVYISTPNGEHYQWTVKALNSGKHVLCEKPFMSNTAEARDVVDLARERGVVIEEAFHWQFHPAAHKVRSLLESGQYGEILRTSALMTASPGVPEGDIRWQFDLAGGLAMDTAYALSFTRYFLRAGKPEKIHSVTMRPHDKDKRLDEAMYAYLTFKTGKELAGVEVQSSIYTDMSRSWIAGVIPRFWELPSIEIETSRSVIHFYNAMMPHLYHYISILERSGGVEVVRQYSGGRAEGWSTYRWQLEAFVARVRGERVGCWVENEDSVLQIEVIDGLYRAAGMPVRGEETGEGAVGVRIQESDINMLTGLGVLKCKDLLRRSGESLEIYSALTQLS